MSRPVTNPRHGRMRNLLSISDLGPEVAAGINEVMTLTDSFVEVINHTNSVVEQSTQKLGIEEENKSLVQDFE